MSFRLSRRLTVLCIARTATASAAHREAVAAVAEADGVVAEAVTPAEARTTTGNT